MSSTIPYGQSKTSSNFDEMAQSPTHFKTIKPNKEISSVPRSEKSKNLTASSGQSASDDFSDENLNGNQYDFE